MNIQNKSRLGSIFDVFNTVFRFQLFRYFLIGSGLFLIDLGVFLSLKSLSVPTPTAQLLSRTTGAAVGFVAHKWFTFRSKERATRKVAMQGTGYLTCTIINIVISPFVVSGFEFLIPNNLIVVKILSEIVIVFETYFVLKWVFKTKQQKVEGTQ